MGIKTSTADQPCIDIGFSHNLSIALGKTAKQKYSLAAGDAVVFAGKLWHRGWGHLEDRISLIVRTVPADTIFEGNLLLSEEPKARRFQPAVGEMMTGPMFPVIYPPANMTIDSEQWPLLSTKRDALEWDKQNYL